MADLPADRTLRGPPFILCGVNYFGPILMKEKRKEIKRYGALCTCLNSRAVHIEVANSLENDSFIMALRRFISIRGNIRSLRSDLGANSIGAERELKEAVKEIDHERNTGFLLHEGSDYLVIRWKKNPPAASHMGGVLERKIRPVPSIISLIFKTHGTSLNDEAFIFHISYIHICLFREGCPSTEVVFQGALQ